MSITRDNYYDHPGISNSALSYALPEMGGSYVKFRAFMAGEIGKEETPEMKLGTLIHKVLENPSTTFQVIESMPSEAICRIIDDIDPDTRPELKDYAKEIFSRARHFNYQKTWGEEAICRKIITEGSEYFKAKHSGAIIIDKATEAILHGVTESLRKDYPSFLDDKAWQDIVGPAWRLIKEAAFTWEEEDITFKMLIDRMEINDDIKVIDIFDFKTTSKPLSLYAGYTAHKIQGPRDKMEIVEEFHHGSMVYYQVPRQLRFYSRGLTKLFPGYTVRTKVVAIEVNAPYEVGVIDLNAIPEYEQLGDKLIEKALRCVHEFYASEISL